MILSFIVKILENILATAKSIAVAKEKYLASAIFNALSAFFYLVAIVQLTKDNSIASIIVMTIATFIGTYIPGLLTERSERNRLYIFDITADSIKSGEKFINKVVAHNIAVRYYKSYDSHSNLVMSCKVFCTTREEFKIVNDLISDNFKYNVYHPLE